MNEKYIFLFLGIIFLFGWPRMVFGVSDLYIGTEAKVSICGNGVVEGEEDCESTNLNDKSCSILGLGGGELKCDIACSFNVSECSLLPTSTPVVQSAAIVTGSSVVPIPTIVFLSPNIFKSSALPLSVVFFDVNGDGKIHLSELYPVVKKWVEGWRGEKAGNNCDVNSDKKCDLTDFSILMYYVDR